MWNNENKLDFNLKETNNFCSINKPETGQTGSTQKPAAFAPAPSAGAQAGAKIGCDPQASSSTVSNLVPSVSTAAHHQMPRSATVIPVQTSYPSVSAQSDFSQNMTNKTSGNAPTANSGSALSGVHLVPKELELMMRRCYDLSAAPRPHNFPKQPSAPVQAYVPSTQFAFPPSSFLPPVNVSSCHGHFPHSAVTTASESHQYVAQRIGNYATAMPGNPVFVIPNSAPVFLPASYASYSPFSQQSYLNCPPVLPNSVTDMSKIPREYLKHLQNCVSKKSTIPFSFTSTSSASSTGSGSGSGSGSANEEYPDTGLVYLLLKSSLLSNDVLGLIWATVNRTLPGQLNKYEFFAALALVAMAQKTGKVYSLEALSNYTSLPIPFFENGCTFFATPTLNKPNSTDFVAKNHKNDEVEEEFNDFTDFQSSSFASNLQNPPLKTKKSGEIEPKISNFLPNSANSHCSNDTKKDKSAFNLFENNFYSNLSAKNDVKNEAKNVNSAQELDFGRKSQKITTSKSLDNTTPVENRLPKINRLENNFNICSDGKTTLRISPFCDLDDKKTINNFSFNTNSNNNSNFNEKISKENINQEQQRYHFSFNDVINSETMKNNNDNLKNSIPNVEDSPSDSCSLKSKEPSLHSLDLKSLKTVDSNEENKDFDAGIIGGNFEYERFERQNSNNNFNLLSSSNNLCDKYAAVREIEPISFEEKHTLAWEKVLEVCNELIHEAIEKIPNCKNNRRNDEFENDEEGKQLLVECDKGAKYVKSIVEIYAVARRIKVSQKAYAFQTENSNALLNNIESGWNILQKTFEFSDLMPDSSEFDFGQAVLKADSYEDQQRACGVCLLDVEFPIRHVIQTNQNQPLRLLRKKLTYSGRHYHSQCANLWVNKVDFLLPALRIPGLLD